jgi:GT2 family glycosyltransferase
LTSTAAVIGNFNGEPHLRECIRGLREQSCPPVEIVVVDGSSTDGSVHLAEQLGTSVIRRPNLGLGHLYNTGVSASSTDFVFLANNDIAPERHCLERLQDELNADASVFAADARQLDWTSKRTIHARTTLTRGGLFHEHLPGLHLDPNVSTGAVAPTICANGAAMLVRRSMFGALGGFDETFFMEWEDLDLCWRAWLRGWPTVYVPGAAVRHRVGAATSSALRPRRSASSHHNLMRFALKCLPKSTAGRVLLGEMLRLPIHPRPIARGALSVVAELGEILRYRRANPPSRQFLDSMLDGAYSDLSGTEQAVR